MRKDAIAIAQTQSKASSNADLLRIGTTVLLALTAVFAAGIFPIQ
ncbi:MAG: hypothetical protein AAGA08_00555 [Pseudomonadota bacterium]